MYTSIMQSSIHASLPFPFIFNYLTFTQLSTSFNNLFTYSHLTLLFFNIYLFDFFVVLSSEDYIKMKMKLIRKISIKSNPPTVRWSLRVYQIRMIQSICTIDQRMNGWNPQKSVRIGLQWCTYGPFPEYPGDDRKGSRQGNVN